MERWAVGSESGPDWHKNTPVGSRGKCRKGHLGRTGLWAASAVRFSVSDSQLLNRVDFTNSAAHGKENNFLFEKKIGAGARISPRSLEEAKGREDENR
jgi:hypothetical protein